MNYLLVVQAFSRIPVVNFRPAPTIFWVSPCGWHGCFCKVKGAESFFVQHDTKESMNKQQWRGGFTRTIGSWRESIGRVTGDRDLEAEGAAGKAAGSVLMKAGDVLDAARVSAKLANKQK